MASGEVKDLIVQSATNFFSRFGFAKTTMDEIAKHIHKAKGVLYYYFKNKEELYNEVIKIELSNIKTELKKITESSQDSVSMFKDYFLTRLRLMKQAVNYHETLKADFFDRYHFVKDVRDDFSRFEQKQIETILEKGVTEGYLKVSNISNSAKTILMVIQSVEIPLYLQNSYDEMEQSLVGLADMFTESLRRT